MARDGGCHAGCGELTLLTVGDGARRVAAGAGAGTPCAADVVDILAWRRIKHIRVRTRDV